MARWRGTAALLPVLLLALAGTAEAKGGNSSKPNAPSAAALTVSAVAQSLGGQSSVQDHRGRGRGNAWGHLINHDPDGDGKNDPVACGRNPGKCVWQKPKRSRC